VPMSHHPSRGRPRRIASIASFTCAFALIALAGGGTAGPRSMIGPYFGASFKSTKTSVALGQAGSWSHDGKVLATLLDSAGISQIYRTAIDGSAAECLTCTTVAGPNGFAQERAQGDWILFASYGQQPVHTGGPGLGGYGGDLYVMRRDGSSPYRLSTTSDPDDGKPYTTTSGTPYDNFHAFFSPDGTQIAWTHTEAQPESLGGQTWSILVGDFVVEDGKPSLKRVRVAGKPYGAYETQPWAPDGSGFLFSAAGGYESPFQKTPPGWGNMQVYYMRIKGAGASIEDPRVVQLSDDMPAYEEQAVFTPDMRTVIMMSNRSHTTPPSWANLVVAAAQRTKYDPPSTGSSQTLQFLADFIPIDHFNADLYAVDVETKAIRQLTSYPGGIIPEFFWNRHYTKLLYANTGVGGVETYVGRFPNVGKAGRRVPKTTPPALHGELVDMSRVGSQAQPIRDPGPTDDVAIAVEPPTDPAPPFPSATERGDTPQVPAVVVAYAGAWLADLHAIMTQSETSFTVPPLLSSLGQFGG
jgi:hypothetical protein